MRRLVLLLIAVGLALPTAAGAQQQSGNQGAALVAPPISAPASPDARPPGFTTSAREATAIAERLPAVRKARREHPQLRVQALIWAGSYWTVTYYEDASDDAKAVVDAEIGPDGAVIRVWTGFKAWAYFARGGFGGGFDAWWVWLPFGAAFLLALVDGRRPRSLYHLDLAALLGLGGAYALFEQGHNNWSLATAFGLMGYLLIRMGWIGLGRGRAPRFSSTLPIGVLVAGVLILAGGRVALDVTRGHVIDVGYASVVGADRVSHGQELYVDNDAHGDTYGPVAYLAYVPFEAIWPWKGQWDDVPAARAAAIAFDLLTLLGLFLLGRGMRAGPHGTRLGLTLAWAWAAFPLTLFGVMVNTNDGLVAMLAVYAMLAMRSPAGRGAVLGLGAAAKFLPGGVVPLLARGVGRRSVPRMAITAVAALAVFAGSVLAFLPAGGVREFWDCTLGFQLSRPADFSPWGMVDGLAWLQKPLLVVALLFAVAVAADPRERTLGQVAALAAAVTIALQLPAGHWFFMYVVWFAPFALIALLAGDRDPSLTPDRDTTPTRTAPAATAT